MTPDRFTGPLRVLRVCMHLLVAALLALVAIRAADGPGGTEITVVVLLLAGVYAAGPALLRGRTRVAAACWLGLLTAGWALLLVLTPDAVWLAFPLFLLQLHLLAASWAVAAVVITTSASVIGFAWHRGAFIPAAAIGPVLGAAVAVATVLGYQALYRENESRRVLIEQLTATRAELAAAEHSAGVLAERERLAREIHDTLAQGLSSIQLLLRAAQRGLPAHPAVVADQVEQARQTAQDNLDEARRFVRALSPAALEDRSLSGALRRLCRTTEAQSDLVVRFQLDGAAAPLPTAYEVALLRIAQSALTNAVTHSGAGRATVTLSYLASRVALDVVDDGAGFDPDTVRRDRPDQGGFGLAAMRARAGDLGGQLSVESAPDQGTALAVSFAYPPTDAKLSSA